MSMEIDISIRGATLEEAREIFSRVKEVPYIGMVEPVGMATVTAPVSMGQLVKFSEPAEDHREENLARSVIPSDELKPGRTLEKGHGNRYHQKWGIPFNSTTEPAKYEAARKLCKKFNKMYPEALKLAEEAKEHKIGKSRNRSDAHPIARPNAWTHEEIGAIEKCPDQNAAITHYHKKFPESKRSPWSVEQRWYIITKANRGIVPGAKAKNGVIVLPAAEKSQLNCDKIVIPADNNLIGPGIRVRQIKPYKGIKILGTAMVLSRKGDLVDVRNGNKKKQTIGIECLVIAKHPDKVALPSPAAKSTKQLGHMKKCPFCEVVMNTRLLHFHARKEHAEQYDQSGLSAYIAGKNIIAPLKEVPDSSPEPIPEVVKKPFPPPTTTGAAALPSQESLTPVIPDEDPLDIHIGGIEGLDDDSLETTSPDEAPPAQEDDEVQSSPAEEPETGDTPPADPPSPAPKQPDGLRRGMQVRHNYLKSDPHYGETGTIERIPQNLKECLVRFKHSSRWVNKDDLVLLKGAT